MMKWMSLVVFVLFIVSISPVGAQVTLDLSPIKEYLLVNATELDAQVARLETAARVYYTLAERVDFDYSALWVDHSLEVTTALMDARDAWLIASPLYEQVEGVVAGVPVLAEYDVILDAGASGEEDPEGGVPFDLPLPDGRTLSRPGNLFGVLESTLWGTRPDYSSGVMADLNRNNEADFGELLPDAAVLVSAAETMHFYIGDLLAASEAWQPTVEDAFTVLVVMVPTMSEYFAAWRDSRFIAGDDATRTDFVVISRLADIEDILGGLIVVYDSISTLVVDVDAAQDEQIRAGLQGVRDYVSDLYAQELAGRVFTAEEADVFGTEAQTRAETLTGQIAQVAALLGVTLPDV